MTQQPFATKRNAFIDAAISSIWLDSVIWKCGNDCGRSSRLLLKLGQGGGGGGARRRKFMTSRRIEAPPRDG